MTREEYLQLLERSVSFKTLTPEEQEKIRQATGQEMLSYIQLFEEEGDLIANAYGNLIDQTEEIVRDFKIEVVKDKKNQLVKQEASQRTEEIENAESLLNNL